MPAAFLILKLDSLGAVERALEAIRLQEPSAETLGGRVTHTSFKSDALPPSDELVPTQDGEPLAELDRVQTILRASVQDVPLSDLKRALRDAVALGVATAITLQAEVEADGA